MRFPPHKALFQQIPYLLSRECLQQLKLLSALSLRLMVIIKAALSSPHLTFTELLGSGNGVVSQQETVQIHAQQFGVYYFLGLLAVLAAGCRYLPRENLRAGRELPDNRRLGFLLLLCRKKSISTRCN